MLDRRRPVGRHQRGARCEAGPTPAQVGERHDAFDCADDAFCNRLVHQLVVANVRVIREGIRKAREEPTVEPDRGPQHEPERQPHHGPERRHPLAPERVADGQPEPDEVAALDTTVVNIVPEIETGQPQPDAEAPRQPADRKLHPARVHPTDRVGPGVPVPHGLQRVPVVARERVH